MVTNTRVRVHRQLKQLRILIDEFKINPTRNEVTMNL